MIHNQRGGIVSFGIVTLVLLGLLAGGLYMSKNQARVARDTDTTTPQVSAPQKDTDNDKEATPTETKPAETPAKKPAAQAPAAAPAPTPAASPSATTASTSRVASTGPSAPLPATGPADTALVTFGLSILGFTGYGLYRSRRSLQRAALRK